MGSSCAEVKVTGDRNFGRGRLRHVYDIQDPIRQATASVDRPIRDHTPDVIAREGGDPVRRGVSD